MEASEIAEKIRGEEVVEHRIEADAEFRKLTGIYLGIVAMLLAITALGGANAAKTIVNANIQASDTYGFYQAKYARQTAYRLAADQLEAQLAMSPALPPGDKAKLQDRIIHWRAIADRYESDPAGGVLEHHASFDWDRVERVRSSDDEGTDGLLKLRRAAENWDVPIVVTTAVQFFESLFANRPSRCRKLHNIARSVIILDEAQTIPVDLLLPCMAALDELARNYGASIVLCTATQPALRKMDNAIVDGRKRPIGFDLDDSNELAPEPKRLYTTLKRVRVERYPDPIADDVVAGRFREQPQMLCIVNSRQHARDLFAAIRDEPGAAHLTTLMCPRHRRRVLAELRRRLADGLPVRLVATSLIEAGVDIDFPEVWRAAAGLDSIAQAAGRCNREGGPVLGRVAVFEPAAAAPPHELKIRWQAARPVLARHNDPLSLDAVRDYYKELYWQKGSAALDTTKVEGRSGILAAIAEQAPTADFPFEAIAEAFHLIKEVMKSVIVPWRAGPEDEAADRLLARIAAQERPRAADLRRLQQYVVPITRQARDVWLSAGVLTSV